MGVFKISSVFFSFKRKKYEMGISLARGRHRQSDVYSMLFGESFANAHDARADVAALERICEHPSFAQRLHTVCRVFENLTRNVEPRVTAQQRATPVPSVHRRCLDAPGSKNDTGKAKSNMRNHSTKSRNSVECARCGDVYSVFFNHKCA